MPLPTSRLCLATLAALVLAGAPPLRVSAQTTVSAPLPGVTLTHLVNGGRPTAMLIVDLCAPGIDVRTTRYEERGALASTWAARTGVDIAVNADFFQVPAYNVIHYARTGGADWPAGAHNREPHPNIAFGPGFVTRGELPPPAAATDVIGGIPEVIIGGRTNEPLPDTDFFYGPHRRTAVGLSADRRTLFIFATDGTMSVPGIHFGMAVLAAAVPGTPPVDWALNLDGGGSSQMWVRGVGQVIPSSRPVATHLGVIARGSGPSPLCPVPAPDPTPPDAGAPDASIPNAAPDAGVSDAGVPDAGSGPPIASGRDAGASTRDAGRGARRMTAHGGCSIAARGAEPTSAPSAWLGLATLALVARLARARRRRGEASIEPRRSALRPLVGVVCAALSVSSTACLQSPDAEACDGPVAVSYQALSSVSCAARSDVGYRSGTPFDITVVTIDGRPVERGTANAYFVMAEAASRDGVEIRIVSGFRTMAEQEYFYHCYTTCSCNDCNLAARPGYSNHQSGHALDLNTSARGVLTWLNAHAAAYGFARTVPSEPWHWEWWGGGPGGGPCAACRAHCEGSVIVSADCGRGDCAAFGSRCVEDGLGARCAFFACPDVGDTFVCVDTTTIGHCVDGAISTGNCAVFGAICSSAGAEVARCVSAACVASPSEVPVEHDTCLADGRFAHCDANGLPIDARACEAGTMCVVWDGVGRCVVPGSVEPEPDPGEPDPQEPDPSEPDPSEPDPSEPDPSEPDPEDPGAPDPDASTPSSAPRGPGGITPSCAVSARPGTTSAPMMVALASLLGLAQRGRLRRRARRLSPAEASRIGEVGR